MAGSRGMLALWGLWAAACAPGTAGKLDATTPAPGPAVAVQVSPPSAALGPGGLVQFASAVSGTTDTRVTWQVLEGSPQGGTVSAAGAYAAPAASGTFHVVATSVADTGKSAAATVTVSSSPPPGGGFPALSYQKDVRLGTDPGNTATCDLIQWTDKDGRPRRVWLANATLQPFFDAPNGGYIHRYEWQAPSGLRRCENSGGTTGGWGFLVNHAAWTHRAWINSKQDGYGSAARLVPIGEHHAVWEYRSRLGTSGLSTNPYVDSTVHYVFKDGDDQFQYAVTFDASAIPAWSAVPGLLGADSRSPYGSINWDGDGAPDRRSGFRLGGDHLIAGDLQAMTWQNLTLSSGGWGLTPFVEAWNTRLIGGVQYDDEIGCVQSRLQSHHRGGHGRGAANRAASGTISGVDLFDYQLMEYQNWFGERTTWQAAGPTGIGQLGVTPGFEDYSLSVLIGPRSQRGVQRLVDEANAVHEAGTALSATRGTVATVGVEGPGMAVLRRWDKPGFDPVYRNWVLVASDNGAEGTLAVAAGRSLRNPTVALLGYTAAQPPAVTRAGVPLTAGVDYLASVNPVLQQAWITFLSSFSGSTAFAFAGPADSVGVDVSAFDASPAVLQSGAAGSVTFNATAPGATAATLDCTALGGGSAEPMTRSGGQFSRVQPVPAGLPGGGPLLVTLSAQGPGGVRMARTAVTVKAPDDVLYSGAVDHVVAGWEPNGHVSKVTTGSPYEGTTHLQIDYRGTGTTADVSFDRAVDVSRKGFLVFAMRGPSLAGQELGVELRAAGNFGSGVRTFARTSAYSRLYVPLAQLPVDLTQVVGLRISIAGVAGAGNVYLDDVSFTAVPPDAPTAAEAFRASRPGL